MQQMYQSTPFANATQSLVNTITYKDKNTMSTSEQKTLLQQQLEELKLIYQNCLELAQKARENFLMCNQLELDEEQSEKNMKLTDALEDLDDVQEVFTNADLDESVFAE